MQCFHCGFLNTQPAKLCQNCGQPLERECPHCAVANPAIAKFCMNCGNRLPPVFTEAEVDAGGSPVQSENQRLARLAAAAPVGLVNKLRLSENQGGERRVVTTLIADVVNSTALSSSMDPEDWTGIMNRAFDLITTAIYRYEGTVARLMGDALLAFFGAPIAHEDDPERAVHAALDLVAALQQFAEEVRLQYGIEFAIRVGLNTGRVVVGRVGSDLVYEYTAMGDAINLAARIQAAARPNSVLISEHTHRSIAPLFECIDRGEISVKGKSEPVHVYEVMIPKDNLSRTREVDGLHTPLIGRESELNLLLQKNRSILSGKGHMVVIVGEAGIGKSRLVAEWQARSLAAPPAEKALWVRGLCLSYAQGMAYHLLADALRSSLGITPGMSDADARQTLLKMNQALFGHIDGELYALLGHLLSLNLEEPAEKAISSLDPQALQAGYYNALQRLLRALTARQPVTLVLEDIHWADPSSVDLFIKLLPIIAEVPILVCATIRPDRPAPGWRFVHAALDVLDANLTEIQLNHLSPFDSSRLVAALLQSDNVPRGILDVVQKKAEGNPLFIEEIIRMLIDQQLIARDEDGRWRLQQQIEAADIPDNLNGLLLARIDRLPEDIKRTLKVAAVIGRHFSARVLEQVLQKQEVL